MSAHSKNGLVVMRCQPFHNGHFSLLHKALNSCNKLYVVLGSTQESRTFKNPFSFEERVTMIKLSMDMKLLERIEIQGVADIFNMRLWGEYVLNSLPEKIDIVFGGESTDISFYPKRIIKVSLERASTPFLSGTKIRELIRNNDPLWKYHVPHGTLNVIGKLMLTGEKLWN